VEAADAVDLVLVDLGEDRLLRDTEGVVAVAVELLRRQAAEVADAGQGERDQAVQELPRAVTAEGDVRADGLALAQLELRNRLLRLGHDGLLAGDRREVCDRTLDDLAVAGCLADAGVDDDLDDAGNLHDVRVTELVLQLLADLATVDLLQARLDFASLRGTISAHLLTLYFPLGSGMSLPEPLATRTRTVFLTPSLTRS